MMMDVGVDDDGDFCADVDDDDDVEDADCVVGDYDDEDGEVADDADGDDDDDNGVDCDGYGMMMRLHVIMEMIMVVLTGM